VCNDGVGLSCFPILVHDIRLAVKLENTTEVDAINRT
jgi:hypothetical protein